MCSEDWYQDDQRMQRVVYWLFKRLGGGWQTALFSPQSGVARLSQADEVEIVAENNAVVRLNLSCQGEKQSVSVDRVEPVVLMRLLMHASTVRSRGFDRARLEEIRRNFYQAADNEELMTAIMAEFSSHSEKKARIRRLFNKFRKDPVLFFRDSRRPCGRLLYFMIKQFSRETGR